MVAPLLIGAGIAGAGLVGSMASGALGKTDSVNTPRQSADGYTFGGSKEAEQEYLARQKLGAAGAQLRSGPQLSWQNADQDRAGQSALSGRYTDILDGKGPSVAASQLQAGQAQNAAQQAAIAAGARGGGGNAILAQRAAAQQAGAAGLATNRDASMLRAQENAAAMSGQSQLLGSMAAGSQARQGLVSQNELAQRSLNDQRSAMFAANERGALDSKLGAGMQFEQQLAGNDMAAQQFNAGLDADARKRKASFFGGMMNGGAGVMGAGITSGAK